MNTSAYNSAMVQYLEAKRLETKKANRGHVKRLILLFVAVIAGIALVVAACFTIWGGYYFGDALTNGFMLSIFALPIALGISTRVYGKKISANNAALTQAFKEGLVKGELERVFTNVQYEPFGRFSDDLIHGLNVIMGVDRISGNDLIHATRGGVPFAQCDLSLQARVVKEDSDGHKTVTYEGRFWGDLMEFTTAKAYPARMLLYTNGLQYVRGVKTARPLANLLGTHQSNAVETESDAFNRRFELACDDQVAARVFFTPQRMKALMDMDAALPEQDSKYEKEFAILYQDNHMYVFVRGHERFELDMSAKALLAQQAQTMAAQADGLARRVDLLVRDAL